VSHFRYPPAQPVGVLGCVPLVERQRALHFPDWSRRQVSEHCVHQPALCPMQSQQSLNVLFHRVADASRTGVSRDAGELGHALFLFCHRAGGWLGASLSTN
jgi:hypothetical protein